MTSKNYRKGLLFGKKIRQRLREKTSPRHVPKLIYAAPPDGIPYTFSNKKVEIAVTKIIHGMSVANRGALRKLLIYMGW